MTENPPVAQTTSVARRGRAALRIIGVAMGVAALLLGLLAAAGWWFWRSEAGSQWLLARLPGVQVEGAQGSVFGKTFAAQRLRVAWNDGKASAELHDLAWQGATWRVLPARGTWVAIHVDGLKLRKLELRTGESSSQRPQPPASLRLPIQLHLASMLVEELVVDGAAPARQVLGRLHLGAAAGTEHQAEVRQLAWEHLEATARLRVATDAPYLVEASADARSVQGPAWQAQLTARGPLSSIDLGAHLLGRAAKAGAAPALDAQAQIRPFEAWPLGRVTATTRALDLSALLPGAPHTRISGRALVSSQGLREPVGADIELDNDIPARWGDGGLPVLALRLSLRADPREPHRLAIGPFDLEAADARGPAGRWSGSGVWEGAGLTLQTKLADLQPQRLDARLAPMRLSGPLRLKLHGLPDPDPRGSPGVPWRGWASLTSEISGALQGHIGGAPDTVNLGFEAEAQSDRLKLASLHASSGGASAQLKAQLARVGGARWQLQSQGELTSFDPSTWFPGAEGSAWRRGPHRLNARWNLDLVTPEHIVGAPPGQWLPALQGQGELKLVDSRLAGVPVSADLQLRQALGDAPAQRSRARGDIRLASARLEFEGSGDPLGSGSADRTSLRWQAPALAELAPLFALVPGASTWAPRQGESQGQAELRGRWPDLGVDIRASGNGVQAGAFAVARAALEARLERTRGQELAVQLDAERVQWQAARLDSLRADVRGSLESHRFEADVGAPLEPPPALAQALAWRTAQGARFRLAGEGSWQPGTRSGGKWSGRFERLGIGAREAQGGTSDNSWFDAQGLQAELQLDENGRVEQMALQPGRATSGPLTLRWTEARWQAGREARDGWRLLADLEPVAIAPWLQRLQQGRPGNPQWSGDLRIGGQLDIRAATRFEADVRLQRQAGDLVYSDGSTSQALGLTQADLQLSAHDGVWRFAPRLNGQMLGRLEGEWSARSAPQDRWPVARAPLDGQIQVQVPALAAWSGWLPPGWRLQGELESQARISGTMAAPGYTGRLQASRVGLRNLLQGIDLREGELLVRLEGDSARVETFSILGGEGRLQAEGVASFGARPQLQLAAKAEKLRVLGRVDRQLVLSGQAAMAIAADRLRLDGKLVADSGLFDLSRRDAPSLDDDVAVNRAQEPEAPMPMRREPTPRMRNAQVALDVDLGQKLRLRGRGLDTLLAGALKISAPQGRLAVHGSVRAQDGTYAAYGQKLEIARGMVSFAGPLDGARLDILALRPNLDARVGVAISGSALDPRVRLYSDPDMSETEKLSWLVLGRGSEGLGRTDTALLQRAALALLAGEGESPADGVLHALGLDEFSIRQSDGEVRETVVSVGKQLGRRWYVGYERGVNATSGTWQLIYRIAQRFTLRAQSGEDNSLDLIWTWRFGKPREPAEPR